MGPLTAHCILVASVFISKGLTMVTDIFWIQWMAGLLGCSQLYLLRVSEDQAEGKRGIATLVE